MSKARLAGGLWLLVIITGMFAEVVVRGRLFVSGDAAATVTNILGAEFLYRSGIVADLIAATAYIGVSVLLYDLFSPESRSLSRAAVALGLAGSAIMAANLINLFGPLVLLGRTTAVIALDAPTTQALSLAALRLHGLGYTLALMVFAIQVGLLGILALRSTFVPRLIGLLLCIEGVAGLADGGAIILAPALARLIHPLLGWPALIAEGSFALWLLAGGWNDGGLGREELGRAT